MLTEERLKEIEELGELAFDGALIKEIAADVVPYIRTLQQQNKQLLEALEQILQTIGYDNRLWTTEWKYETVIDIAKKAIEMRSDQ